MSKIKEISCHKILDSRGQWTLDTKVTLENGVDGSQTIPNGASTGENESYYIPNDKAVIVVTTIINKALKGMSVFDQKGIDQLLIAMDGTPNKRHLGGNSVISVSLAVAQAAAKCKDIPLYEYLAGLYGKELPKKLRFPTPVFNVLNGGKHAGNGLSFQEFMVIPAPHQPFDKQIQIGMTVYESLENLLSKDKYSTGVGDEGGFAPEDFTVEKAFEYISKSVSKHYKLGEDVFLGMDVAAESFFDGEDYDIKEQDLTLNRKQLLDFYKKLVKKYPLIYIEDPYYENDVDGWSMFYKEFNEQLMVVADDLVVTNPIFLKKAIDSKLANAVIVKPNQVGTLTETLEFIKMAKKNKMTICISHRSGDTPEDTFIADLALATQAEFIKSGSPVRGERVAKYNRLLDVFFGDE
jgi:enolase